MNFGWETKKEKILKGLKISAKSKLEGMRMMNELADKVLTGRQKIQRRKLHEAGL